MAAIEKIYGSRAQRRELKAFLMRHGKRTWFRYFYPVNYESDNAPLTFFPREVDRWLKTHCLLPWVQQRLREQYLNWSKL